MPEESRKFNLAYHIKYSADPMDPQSLPQEYGVADQILIMAIVKGGDDGKSIEDSYSFAALNGATGEMIPPQEVFQSWMVLAQMLTKNLADGDPRKTICEKAVKSAFKVFSASVVNPYH